MDSFKGMDKPIKGSRIPGFYNLSLDERLAELSRRAHLSAEEVRALSGQAGLTAEQADHMVENVVGIHALPLGIALNFVVNDREVLVPMAVEEPSIVAGASFMAKLARAGGGFRAQADPPEMIGQIQLLEIKDLASAKKVILEQEERLLSDISDLDPVLKRLGGGPRCLEVRLIQDSHIGPFLVVHLVYDVQDAMGANAVNTAVEHLAPQLESISGGKAHLRILSNLADRRLARAQCVIPLKELGFEDYPAEEVRDGIIAAWAFAVADPYRAATHNKGIMNGIDPVVIATGNDWRAIEAGAHAYAARNGCYSSLSTWRQDEQGNLLGLLELPMAVGIIGGATRVHPVARACLKLMGVNSAGELAEIIASVGLAQNLAALRALATEGIQRGHMGLHARQVAIAAGAQGEMIECLAARLVAEKTVRIDRASQILEDWKAKD
jgi:hydroxymethylglutaryl-CoA reductase